MVLAVAPSFTYTFLSVSLVMIAIRLLALLAKMLVLTAAETTLVTDDVEYVAATTAGKLAMSTSPMLLFPTGNAVDIVTAPVLQVVTLPFKVESVDSVAAPVGNETVPVTLAMFHVPDCVAATVPSTVIDPALSEIGMAVVNGLA